MGFMLKDHHVNRERDVMPYFNEAHYPDPTAGEALAMRMNFVLLRKCRELWAFGTEITEGMQCELEKARALRLPVRCFSTKFEEVVWE